MKVINRLGFELANFDTEVQHFTHYATGTLPNYKINAVVHTRTLNLFYTQDNKKKQFRNVSQQLEIYKCYTTSKQYIEGVHKWGKSLLIMKEHLTLSIHDIHTNVIKKKEETNVSQQPKIYYYYSVGKQYIEEGTKMGEEKAFLLR